MGTFAALYKESGAVIPDERKAEFASNVEKLFQAAGFMQGDVTYMYGKRVWMLYFPRPDDRGNINVTMNFFEDDSWEDAGYNAKQCCIYSDKIGWGQFHTAVVAAYMLEALYTDGPAIPLVNGEPVFSKKTVGWINHVLGTDFLPKNHDPWPLYEAFHENRFGKERMKIIDWLDEAVSMRDVDNFIAICAIEKGVPRVISRLEEESRDRDNSGGVYDDVLAIHAYQELREFKSSHEQPDEEQIDIIFTLFREYLHCEEISKAVNTEWEEKGLIRLNLYLAMTGCIRLAVAFVADIYGRDFWELWETIKSDAAECRLESIFEVSGRTHILDVAAVSTVEMFSVESDRLLAYWSPGCDIHFSDEMKESLGRIKHRFDEIMKSDGEIKGGLRWIYGLIVRGSKEYYRIYTFRDFFEETIDHLTDRKYLAAWKIYEEMLDDPGMRAAGSVIFSDEEYGSGFLDRDYDTAPKYRLIENWTWMPAEKKYNKARVMLQGYLSLLFNKSFREKVLGF